MEKNLKKTLRKANEQLQVLPDIKTYTIPQNTKPVEWQMTVYSDRMHPDISKGDALYNRDVVNWDHLIWGEIYAVSVCDTIILTRLYKGCDDQHILSVSNGPNYPDQELNKSWITRISIVTGRIRMSII